MHLPTSPVDHFRHWASRLIHHHDPVVYQSSTISALLDGIYDSDVTVADILKHGDFGLGTFARLDGEMVVLDGICYRLRADGTASRVRGEETTPFAAVTYFRPDFTIDITEPTTRAQAIAEIDAQIASPNLIYAIRVSGAFATVHTRTVMAQTAPYPPLAKATEGQAETQFGEVTGTLVGFRTPDFEQGISVAGYHLHFLNSEHSSGGHVLDFTLTRGTIAVSAAAQMHLSLPTSGDFLHAHLSGPDVDGQIRKSEG